MAKVVDNYGLLSEAEVAFIKQDAEEMDFDFIRYADEVTVYISRHEPAEGETWRPEFDVLIEGTSEEDERGNGYFGYDYTRSLLADKMKGE